MKVAKATEKEINDLRRQTRFKLVIEAIDNAEHGEYIKISELPSGKTCVTLAKYLRNAYFEKAIRLSIRTDPARNTIYVAKKTST